MVARSRQTMVSKGAGEGRGRDACTVARPGGAAPTVLLESTVTCPECGTATRARMPTDTCQFFWECPACGVLLRPHRGDCCVFCSFGDVPCPPMQRQEGCAG